MTRNWLLQLIDHSLSDSQLDAVKPAQVHLIVLSLFRDLFRHHATLFRPATSDRKWVETLFDEIARRLQLRAEAITDEGRPYNLELDNLKHCDWARSLAAPFSLPPEKLVVCHSAIVTGVTEELGAHRKPSKRWWQFWK